jgi:hypothetical protein
LNRPVEILLKVARIGGQLNAVNGRLRVLLPEDCPPGLKEEIRQHKTALLSLLSLAFGFRSDVLSSIIFFVADDATKQSLVRAGVDPGIIYTKFELAELVHKRVTRDELPRIHAAKQIFHGSKVIR